jgi:hypothetical protein
VARGRSAAEPRDVAPEAERAHEHTPAAPRSIADLGGASNVDVHHVTVALLVYLPARARG